MILLNCFLSTKLTDIVVKDDLSNVMRQHSYTYFLLSSSLIDIVVKDDLHNIKRQLSLTNLCFVF